jgi:HlyD family secretion protein
MRRHLKWIVPVAVVLVLVLIFVGRGRRRGGSASPGGSGAPSGAADTLGARKATAAIDDISVELAEVGDIQPKTMVVVKSKVSGKVRTLSVHEGEYVKKGAVLATVEPDMPQALTVANLKSSYGRAKVQLDRARQDYDRDLALHESGHISDQELKVSKDAYDIADVEYQSALEQMRLAREDGVTTDVASEGSQFLDIVAPASGTVIAVDIEEGEIVTSGAMSYSSGTTLMTIADLTRMQIKAGVNEVDVGKIRPNEDVAIDVDAYPNLTYHGVITHIAPAARDQEGVRIFDVEIDITDTDERLRPGMTANIEIQGDRRDDVLTVPIEAAFKKEGRYVVYVFDGSAEEPVERDVVTGLSNISRIEIVSGLAVGDVVALYDPTAEAAQSSDDQARRQRMAAGGQRRGD